MARREYTLRFRCGHPGCSESVVFRYETLRDRKDSFEVRNYHPDKWRCVRHCRPGDVLASDNPCTEAVLTVEKKEYGHYFGTSGLVTGPGFKAFAADFPPGTRLVVTTRIELPEGDAA